MNKVQQWQLQQRQSLPLEVKERFTARRIRDWYEYFSGAVYVAFSGGKDSTVLLHQVRKLYPDVPAIFVNTGLEYPENVSFVKSIDNVVWLSPKKTFRQVIDKYGYPMVSKEVAQQIEEVRNTKSEILRNARLYGNVHGNGKIPKKWQYLIDCDVKISPRCCVALKKAPFKAYNRKTGSVPFLGTLASESSSRKRSYLKNGCNAVDAKTPASIPMAFWLDTDIWEYINKYSLPYSELYKKGYTRSGCMFCMFGVHLEKGKNRFQMMKETHPDIYGYCISRMGIGHCLDILRVKYD